jgi:hypothetical protein
MPQRRWADLLRRHQFSTGSVLLPSAINLQVTLYPDFSTRQISRRFPVDRQTSAMEARKLHDFDYLKDNKTECKLKVYIQSYYQYCYCISTRQSLERSAEMSTNCSLKRKILKNLLTSLPAEVPVTTRQLEAMGISRQLAHRYVQSG